jgi:hypothetical protein
MIFVNVYEHSSTSHGDYIVYRFYSGDSEDSVKRMIIEHTIDSWDGAGDEVVDALEELETSLSFKEIAWRINDILNNLTGDQLNDYDLIIGDPTTDISYGLDFYSEYEEDDTEEASFYFYGGYAIKIQNLFPYVYNLMKDYGVVIDNRTFDMISKNII